MPKQYYATLHCVAYHCTMVLLKSSQVEVATFLKANLRAKSKPLLAEKYVLQACESLLVSYPSSFEQRKFLSSWQQILAGFPNCRKEKQSREWNNFTRHFIGIYKIWNCTLTLEALSPYHDDSNMFEAKVAAASAIAEAAPFLDPLLSAPASIPY